MAVFEGCLYLLFNVISVRKAIANYFAYSHDKVPASNIHITYVQGPHMGGGTGGSICLEAALLRRWYVWPLYILATFPKTPRQHIGSSSQFKRNIVSKI